jgi:rhodanese-related sulfurtransferase
MRESESDLTPKAFVSRRDAGETWQLIDVREHWEVALASVDGATVMPMSELHRRVGELEKSVPVAVLCHSGIRSAQVAGWLRQLGFAEVANVIGGIDAWSTTVDPRIPRY